MSAERTESDPTGSRERGIAALHAPFVDALPVDGATISVVTAEGTYAALSSSGGVASQLEQLQFELGEGPHWEAIHTGRPVLVPDTSTSEHTRWPIFDNAVEKLPIRALFSFPILLGAVTIGVVNLYRSTPRALSASEIDRAVLLASEAAGPASRQAIGAADDDHDTDSVLLPGMRREVHQATGMVSVQLDTTLTDAFSRLRARAYSTDRSVQQVAHDVVAREFSFHDAAD